jgi:molecular chaperone GrpE
LISRSRSRRAGDEKAAQADATLQEGGATAPDEAEGAESEADAEASAVKTEETPGVDTDTIAEERAIEEELARALVELDELRDRHLRLAAEFENYRKRTRREQAELGVVAQADLVRRVLATLDDLARVAHMPRDSTTVEALEKGVELILRNLGKELEDAGLRKVDAENAAFDPEVHQAVLITEVEDPELDGTISRVLLDGYVFRGRLVRPAQVEVRRHVPGEGEERTPGDRGDE